ncbi:unnamed protein product, partial [Polarella glacialis]
TAVALEAVAKQSGFSPFGLSNLAWCFAKLQALAPEGVGTCAEEAAGVASLRQRFLGALVQETRAKLSGLEAQDIAGLAWAFAAAKVLDQEGLVGDLCGEALRKLDQFRSQQLSNLSWSLATLMAKDTGLLRQLAQAAEGLLSEFEPQALSNVAWAFATLKPPDSHHRLLQAIAAEASTKLRGFSPQGLSNLVWSFAKARTEVGGSRGGKSRSKLLAEASSSPVRSFQFEAIAQEAKEALGHFKPQDASNFAWAMASLAVADQGNILGGIAREAVSKMASFTPQNLANLLWAFASLLVRHPAFLQAAEARARHCLWEFKTQALSNLAWALATDLRKELPPDPDLEEEEAEEEEEETVTDGGRSSGTRPEGGQANRRTGALSKEDREQRLSFFSLVAGAAAARASHLAPQGLANLAWACATLGSEEQVFREFALQATARSNELQLRDASNLAWALVTMDAQVSHSSLLQALAVRAEAILTCPETLLPRRQLRLSLLDDVSATMSTPGSGLGTLANIAPSKSAMVEVATSILGLLWALSFSGGLAEAQATRLKHLGHQTLREIGRSLDGGGRTAALVGRSKIMPLLKAQESNADRRRDGRSAEETEPLVVLDLPDRLVLHKPPG